MSEYRIQNFDTGYVPRKHQSIIHKHLKRFNVLLCHRRFGKTITIVNEIIDKALKNPLRNPRYAYIAPTYKQAKNISWRYFLDYTRVFSQVGGAHHNYRMSEKDLTIKIKRTWLEDSDYVEIMLLGSDNPDSLRGIYLDGCAIDEADLCVPSVWTEIIRPALSDRETVFRDLAAKGKLSKEEIANYTRPFAIICGTPKGRQQLYKLFNEVVKMQNDAAFYEHSVDIDKEKKKWSTFEKDNKILYHTTEKELEEILSELSKEVVTDYHKYRNYLASADWYCVTYKASETGIIPQRELDALKKEMDNGEYMQEYECSPEAVGRGAYFAPLLNVLKERGQIGNFGYNQQYLVETFWDIGYSDKTCIWFRQKIGNQYFYIDYYENQGYPLTHYLKVLTAKRQSEGMRTLVEDNVEIKGMGYQYGRVVLPFDSGKTEFGGGMSIEEQGRKLGYPVTKLKTVKVQQRINAARERLKVSYFHVVNCLVGLESLYNYEKEWSEEMHDFKDSPKHNWASHASDAFCYSALDSTDASASFFYMPNKEGESMDINRLTARGEYDILGYH